MAKLSKEYTLLFNGITDTIQELQTLSNRLAALQLQAEELYISSPVQSDNADNANQLPA